MLLEEFMNQANEVQVEKLNQIFEFIGKEYPELHIEMKWNQPMFILDKTFIIGFSVAKKHISFAPEKVILDKHTLEVSKHYKHTKMLVKIEDNQEVNFDLLKLLIDDSIELKRGYDKFWY